MEKLLKYHAERYPLMQPADAVKLLYQNELGIGHLISDPELFNKRLYEEASSVSAVPGIPLSEPIGNSLIRVMLNSPESKVIIPERLTDACLQTAAEHHGTMASFLNKIRELENACRNGLFQFSDDELYTYLAAYRLKGCPPVSHSSVYREAYHPSYRVIRQELLLSVISGS